MTIEEKLKILDQEREDLLAAKNKLLPFLAFIPVVFLMGLLFNLPLLATSFLTIATAAIASLVYYSQIYWQFNDLAASLKSAFIDEYMRSYHPDTTYKYQQEKKDVQAIIRTTRLISANRFKEENVLIGNHKGINFYLSEIDLVREVRNNSIKIFKGMMFRFSVPGKNFPHSLIQSKVGLVKKYLVDFKKNNKYGFQYATANEAAFQQELETLLPFFDHLIKQQGDLRIETQGEEILILLASNEYFLDDPQIKLDQSFLNKTRYANVVRQVNSFLYIIEAFSSDLGPEQVEEQLELRMLDILKNNEIGNDGNAD